MKPIKVRWLREIMSKYADGDMEVLLMVPHGVDVVAAKATQVKVTDYYEDESVKKVLLLRAK